MVRTIALLVSVLVFAAACSRWQIGNVNADTSPAPNWSVRLSVSGGLAGVRQYVDVSSNGQVTAVDEKLGTSASSTLGRQDILNIQDLVIWRSAAPSSAPGTFRGSACIDCFVYRVDSKLNGQETGKQYSGLNIAELNERQLIRLLSKVLREQLGNKKQEQ